MFGILQGNYQKGTTMETRGRVSGLEFSFGSREEGAVDSATSQAKCAESISRWFRAKGFMGPWAPDVNFGFRW